MSPENELHLSFYQEVTALQESHDIYLVKHVETGRLFVRKQLTHYDKKVYEALQQGHFNGIPVIQELIETDDALILIEEYISGQTIEEILQHRIFSEDEAVRTMTDLCRILRPLHMHIPQIIHRDIKASNVMISDQGQVFLIDFDASKFYDPSKSRDTVLIGTENYAAPEQYGFGQSDSRTDIYACGVLICKMLTGKTLGESQYDGPLAGIIRLCTQMDPDDRFKTVDALSTALSQYERPVISAVPATSDTSTVPTPHATPVRRSGLQRFIRQLPGFQSGRPLPAVLGAIWYLFIISGLFFGTSHDKNGQPITGAQAWLMNIYVVALFMTETLYLGNAFGWRERFPFKKRRGRSLFLGAARIILGAALIFGAYLIVTTILSLIIEIV